MDKEEYQRKMAEIKANYTPAQAKAARLLKPVFISIACLFLIIFIALVVSSSNTPKSLETPKIDKPSQAEIELDKLEAAKWKALSNLTDCQLAYNIYSDYSPIMNELLDFAKTKTVFNKSEAVNWKEVHQLDKRLETLSKKYPSNYTVNYPNSLIAHGMDFAIGQYWRDIFFHSSNDRLGRPLESDQPSLMQDDFNVLKSQCPNEFEGLKHL